MKKITLTTIKSFIKRQLKNENLYIKNENNDWRKALAAQIHTDYNQGVSSAWFVRGSRDYFTEFANDLYIGYEVSNSCGSFILAMKRLA